MGGKGVGKGGKANPERLLPLEGEEDHFISNRNVFNNHRGGHIAAPNNISTHNRASSILGNTLSTPDISSNASNNFHNNNIHHASNFNNNNNSSFSFLGIDSNSGQHRTSS